MRDTLIRQLFRRVQLMVGRAVLTAVDDSLKLQAVQVEALSGEVVDGAERFQQYGFSSHPHRGAEALLLALGGIRQHPVVAAVDDRRYRVTGLEEGEVCLYTDEDEDGSPHRVILRRGRIVEIHGAEILLSAADGASTIRMNETDVLIDSPHVGIND